MEVHSKWQCPKCPKTYESPLVGTVAAHRCTAGGRTVLRDMKRVWRSKYDRMKG